IVDLAAVASFAQNKRIFSGADNTFSTPWIQRPLELGFDLFVHSATKYLNGHSHIVSGIAVAGNQEHLAPIVTRLGFLPNAARAIAGPFDSFLALRGLKTLAVRMERHCSNAASLAVGLESHPKVRQVRYPGLSSHPQHGLAKRQMRAFGGMITIHLDTDLAG